MSVERKRVGDSVERKRVGDKVKDRKLWLVKKISALKSPAT
jgi:hypothetical protein